MKVETIQKDEFCEKLKGLGWKELKFDTIKENLFSDSILWDIFISQFKKINSELFEKYGYRKEEIINELRNKLTFDSAQQILSYLKFGIPLSVTETEIKSFKLIDYSNISNNEFHYVREFALPRKDFLKPNYADIILFVNGFPIVIIEGKRKTVLGSYFEALKQLMRYQYQTRNVFKFLQMGIAKGDEDYYMPVFERDDYYEPDGYTKWKTYNGTEYISNIIDLISPSRLLDVLLNFVFFTKKSQKKKIIARYMQYFSVKKILDRVSYYLSGESKKNKGLIWHWQGSGKTLTMFFAAFKFFTTYENQRPISFIVVDRRELQGQSEEAYRDIDLDELKGYVNTVKTISELKDIINNIDKEFGLKIVTIQKFRPDEFLNIKEVNKKNILILIDEAHRSQSGELAASMKKIFKSALFFGFTGTPIFRYERNTFKEFGYPEDKELYLDVYFVKQSVKDGYTVPIVVETLKENYFDIKLSEDEVKALIEKYYSKGEMESFIKGLQEIQKKRVRHSLTKRRVILENDEWIRSTVEVIKNRIENDTNNYTFKAMIVAPSRLACIKYKKYIDQIFRDPNISEVVMSYEQNDDPQIMKYRDKLMKRYNTTDWSSINQRIKEEFIKNKDSNPRILIVTDMLITGFDAPQLRVIYLNKILLFHRLLQLIARTDRPYKIFRDGITIEKKNGLVVDFVGLIKMINNTVNIYNFLANEKNSKKIASDFEKVFSDPEKELKLLNDDINTLREKLKDYDMDLDKLVNLLSEDHRKLIKRSEELMSILALYYTDENPNYAELKKIILLMKEVNQIYKSLGGYPGKLEHRNYVTVISLLYLNFIREINKGKKKVNVRRLIREILSFVSESTFIGDFEKIYEIEIKTPSELKPKIKERLAANEFYELKNSIRDKTSNPLYKEIYDRIMKIQEEWVKRKITIEELIKKVNEEKKKFEMLEEERSLGDKIRVHLKQLFVSWNINADKYIDKVISNVSKIVKEGVFLEAQRKELETSIKMLTIEMKNDLKISDMHKFRKDILGILEYLIQVEINDNKRRSNSPN